MDALEMGGAYDSVGCRYDLSSGTPNAEGTILIVPGAANIDVCPKEGSRPQGPGCLPVGSELAAKSAGGGARLTLLGSDDNTGVTTWSLDGGAAASLR